VSVVAVGSLRGSPGATTVALALGSVWRRPGHQALVVEADPDGGVLAARLGLGHHPCLTDLAVRARAGARADLVWEAVQALPGGGAVVVSHPSPDQCHATLRSAGARLAEMLRALADHDAIVDVGRLRPLSPAAPMTDAADIVLVVLRPRLEDVDTAGQRLPILVEGARAVGLVVVGDEPYHRAEVEAVLGVPVLAVVPVDARSAAAVTGATPGPRALHRLPWLRAVRALADGLAAFLDGETGMPPVRRG
jgi:MinD-like ATPase involved in chromosome partitioning or flagellar assembly